MRKMLMPILAFDEIVWYNKGMGYVEVVKRLAKEEGLTLNDVAKRLGIGRQALYYRLRRDMKVSTLEEILSVVGAELSYTKGGRSERL